MMNDVVNLAFYRIIGEKDELIRVMIIYPLILNIFGFWVADSVLCDKRSCYTEIEDGKVSYTGDIMI